MRVASKPADEAERLEVLRSLCLLDTPPDPFFDSMAALAKTLSGAPIAVVSLVDADRQWFKAKVGLDAPETPRDVAFCAHAILGDSIFWVADARRDPRFSGNPLVTGQPAIRLYAGVPLTVNRRKIGTLCIIDTAPRTFDAALADDLGRLARLIEQHLENRRTQALTTHIINAAVDGVVCADVSGRISFWNPACHTLFGWTAEEAIGRSLDLIVPEEHRAAHHGGFARFMTGGAPKLIGRAVEVPAVRKDGSELTIELTLAAWSEVGRPVVGAIIRDVTQRKLAEAALARARDEAEAAAQAKTAFLAEMSHELRTPLNGVIGMAGALRLTDLSSEQVEAVQAIESSAQALDRTLCGVLDLAYAGAGRLALERTTFSPEAVARAIGDTVQAEARRRGVVLQVWSADAPATCLGDAERFRHVLAVLTDTALASAGEGGAVMLTLGSERAGGESWLTVNVADSGGEGAAAAAREQSTVAFSVARELVTAMSGALTVTAHPKRGTLVALRLPTATGADEAGTRDPDSDDAGLREAPLRVLLAEDNPTNRRVIELLLQAADVSLTCAENGLEALDAWRASPFDLVLMDVRMPVMDGLSAIREMRRREASCGLERTPVLVVSANAMPQDLAASTAAGADGHLAKPVRADTLYMAMERAMESVARRSAA